MAPVLVDGRFSCSARRFGVKAAPFTPPVESGSEWYEEYGIYPGVHFWDPDLRVEGNNLVWNAEASGPGCYLAADPSTHWPGQGYVYMEIRRLDENGEPAGEWLGVNPFSPTSTPCSPGGHYLSVKSTTLSGSNAGWGFWELRYVDPPTVTNRAVYMLARTTAAGTAQCSPSHVRAIRAGIDFMTIAWRHCNVDVDSFEVQRLDKVTSTWVNIGTTTGSGLYFRDGGLLADMTYSYRVRSIGASGVSRWSNADTAQTLGASGSAWYRDFSTYGQIEFPDPLLHVRSDGGFLSGTSTPSRRLARTIIGRTTASSTCSSASSTLMGYRSMFGRVSIPSVHRPPPAIPADATSRLRGTPSQVIPPDGRIGNCALSLTGRRTSSVPGS